ncbi:MAG: hypothetical protein KKG54_09850 [Alphaproteobacteria bacterium]|uniref:hypothetical protein n=1 Tax=Brevundimonas sp. TaxID=1871086 RepID=UPI00180C128B|nr:hypothetical protein [Brevundimonas sp.]MBA3048872.1 hypothetical protein [Brevundimonas sp.]MBU3971091.1 hypothetical protein [Alphaproteobacteria bacterium]MBU4039732.1 hypothetical protein [Alphaproteobacteria bacterium]MBU4137403.1 hypothetical protein [Alphaproteobacteria bacterium]
MRHLDTARRPRHSDAMITPALLLALAVPAPLQDADPLVPARDGQLQCHSPDTARKTCTALAGYTFAADGTIANQAEVMLSSAPVIIMRDVAPVVVRDGAVCGPMTGFEDAVFTVDGQPAGPATAQMIRVQVTAAFAQLGTEGCTTYSPQGEGWLAEAVIDGQPRPDLNQLLIWVSPSEGYSVRP